MFSCYCRCLIRKIKLRFQAREPFLHQVTIMNFLTCMCEDNSNTRKFDAIIYYTAEDRVTRCKAGSGRCKDGIVLGYLVYNRQRDLQLHHLPTRSTWFGWVQWGSIIGTCLPRKLFRPMASIFPVARTLQPCVICAMPLFW